MTTATSSSQTVSARPRVLGFVVFQLVLLAGAVGWCGYRAREWDALKQLPPLRETPLSVAPLYDYPVVVADDQLKRVLTKLRPRNGGEKTKVNHIDHALRFWGVPARFADPACFSGEDLRAVLTDDGRFHKQYGANAKPLLIDYRGGVRVRTAEGAQSASHVDHTLAGLAEVGTPLDFPLTTSTRQTTYRTLLEQSLRDFSLNQTEYEWSGMAYALFIPAGTSWRTSEGQQIDFDRLAERIMRQDVPQGVCFGNHRLYTLTLFLRIDEEHGPLLRPETREAAITFLADMTTRLVQSQHADGYWDGDWPGKSIVAAPPEKSSGDAVADRILATGHALEWWAMVPQSTAEKLHPPRDVLVRSGQWLVKTIDNLTDEQIESYYTFLSHAGRALSIWRNQLPYEVSL